MKGLLIKDLCLMKMQKKFFIVIILIALVMAFSTENISFLIGYLTFILPMFAISTVSYDEFDGGGAFLFTLPVSRKLYVLEKYIFASLLGIFAFLTAILLSFIVNSTEAKEALKGVLAVFSVMMLIISVMLPLQLKFGAEKGRIAFIIFGGTLFLFGLGANKLLKILNIDIYSVFNALTDLKLGVLIAVSIAMVSAIIALSIIISMAIMKKKEF